MRRLLVRPSSVVELSGHGPNPARIGLGTSPWIGDLTDDLISIPPAPPAVPGSTPGYLVRICALDVRVDRLFRFRGFWQDVRLGFSQTNDVTGQTSVYEIPQRDPYWQFPDGFITWMIRVETGRVDNALVNPDVSPRVGFLPYNAGSTASGVLYVAPFDGARGSGLYLAPGGGIPPGSGLGAHGAMHSLRATSFGTAQTVSTDIPIEGPARVTFYAYVVQHNAVNVLPAPTGSAATLTLLSREDQLLIAQPTLAYTRIGGGMFGDLGTPDFLRPEGTCP